MANYREIAFDIDFAGKKANNVGSIVMEELTQNDHNSSVLVLRLLQKNQPIDLTGLTVALNFLLPSGNDYSVDIVNEHSVNARSSLVMYSLPKQVLSEIGVVVGTVSLYKAEYRYTSIVQFRFEVVSDLVREEGIIEDRKYPILVSLIGEVEGVKTVEASRVEAEVKRVKAEQLRVEKEDKRENAELIRAVSELEREEAELIRIQDEGLRNTKELERQEAEALRITSHEAMKASEDIRVQQETSRVANETQRQTDEQARKKAETDRQTKETARQQAETLRQQAEASREAKQNEFNTRAEQVATRIEEEAVRITNLVEIEDGKIVHEADKTDYMGTVHKSIKDASDSNVEYILGEVNTVSYEGQKITATDTIEKQVKSATLKGQTLVNLHKKQTYGVAHYPTGVFTNLVSEENNASAFFSGGTLSWFYGNAGVIEKEKFKPSTKYLIVFGKTQKIDYVGFVNGGGSVAMSNWGKIENNKAIITTTSTFPSNEIVLYVKNSNGITTGDTFQFSNAMIFEYQEGMENWDIPYFEGMASVVNPSVTDIGKNFISEPNMIIGEGINSLTGEFVKDSTRKRTDFIKYGSNKKFALQGTDSIFFYDVNKNFISRSVDLFSTTPSNCEYIVCRALLESTNIQLEDSTVATEYEPYKSNTITTTEEIVLRSLPNGVCDTLNVRTGEYVQRIGETTLDGTQAMWKLDELSEADYCVARYKLTDTIYQSGVTNVNLNCDRFKTGTIAEELTAETIKVHSQAEGYNEIRISIQKSKLSSVDGTAVGNYLSQNNTRIQYELATPIVKTVDLNNQRIYSYDGTTHYICGSNSVNQSLIPTLAIDVPTNLASLVSRQNSIIEVQKEQIQTLEQENAILTETQAVQDEDILVNLLASTELFEMVLGLTPSVLTMSDDGKENSMVEVYVTLILKGQKTIEDVPMIIREKVQAQLDLILE